MHAALVSQWGESPKYVEVPDLSAPTDPESKQIKVEYVGIHTLVRSRAAGKHYTSGKPPQIPGVDGVGTIIDSSNNTTQDVYFSSLGVSGSLVEAINLPNKFIVPIPANSDKQVVASLVNGALASYLSLRTRTRGPTLPKDFTILIHGVTGLSGNVAVGVARTLGAKYVIGVGRNLQKLSNIPGLDHIIPLTSDPSTGDQTTDYASALSSVPPIDIVMDFLWGAPTSHLLTFIKAVPGHPIQWLEVGAVAGPNAAIPANLLRSQNVTFTGSGPGAWSSEEYVRELPGIVQTVVKVAGEMSPEKKEELFTLRKLKDVEEAWTQETGGKRLAIEI